MSQLSFERYDRIVDHYPAMWPLLVPGYLPLLNGMLDVMNVRGERPREILDLGCGPGTATVAVAPACDPNGHVTLVDGSATMLRTAQGLVRAHVREAVQGDFTTPAIADWVFVPDRFDLVLCSFALHHITDDQKRQTIERIGKALKRGGTVLIADEITNDRPAGWDVVERVRARAIQNHVQNGHISQAFWNIETTLPPHARLPFLPSRVEDLTSYLARAGLAVSSPLSIFGSALLIGIKP